jgi:hypothetical protein
MPDRIDPTMDAMEAPTRDSPTDGCVAQARLVQLLD